MRILKVYEQYPAQTRRTCQVRTSKNTNNVKNLENKATSKKNPCWCPSDNLGYRNKLPLAKYQSYQDRYVSSHQCAVKKEKRTYAIKIGKKFSKRKADQLVSFFYRELTKIYWEIVQNPVCLSTFYAIIKKNKQNRWEAIIWKVQEFGD